MVPSQVEIEETPLYCSNCGMSIFPGWNYCAFCSSDLTPPGPAKHAERPERVHEEVRCPACKEPIGVGWSACTACSARIEVEEVRPGRYEVYRLVREEPGGPSPAPKARKAAAGRRPARAAKKGRPASRRS